MSRAEVELQRCAGVNRAVMEVAEMRRERVWSSRDVQGRGRAGMEVAEMCRDEQGVDGSRRYMQG